MIFIERPPAPEFLTKPKGRWQKETALAKEHYKQTPPPAAFEFKAYNAAPLKKALRDLFTKCAYCESTYLAVSDGDVEHFRPKGKINEKDPQTPGYFWLANEWDNLFISCQHCNQLREHQLYGEDELRTRGKLDQFPLSDETKRLSGPEASAFELAEEEKARLLLNPCRDNPEEHFAYDDKEAVIIPRTKMGEVSVEIYVLKRRLLVEERKKVLIALQKQIRRVKRELERLDQDKSPDQKEAFEDEMASLEDFTKHESTYAGMSRFFVRQFFKENHIRRKVAPAP